jgi:hypothetical protein
MIHFNYTAALKKTFIILLFLIASSGFTSAQIELIKSAADAASSGEFLSSGCADGCADGCCYPLFNDFSVWAFEGLAKHHKFIVNNHDDYPTGLSFDFMPHAGYDGGSLIHLLPRIRGTWGVISTDFRLNYLAEIDPDYFDSYRTVEWQAFVLNTFPDKHFNLRVGTGILYDDYTSISYNEHFMGAELYILSHKFTVAAEGRMAFDYGLGLNVFSEAQFRLNYRYLDTKHLFGYLTMGATMQEYYSTVNIVTFLAGLSYNFH